MKILCNNCKEIKKDSEIILIPESWKDLQRYLCKDCYNKYLSETYGKWE